MKLIQPSVELYPQENYTLEGIYKQIEKCSRVSYKSEDKITDSSSKTFVDNLIKAGHYATLEHGTVYLMVHTINPAEWNKKIGRQHLLTIDDCRNDLRINPTYDIDGEEHRWAKEAQHIAHKLAVKYTDNPYSKVNIVLSKHEVTTEGRIVVTPTGGLPIVEEGSGKVISVFNTILITTNYRTIIENGWEDDLQFLCAPTKYHAKRYCVKLTTNIGVTRESNRHRSLSTTEMSTRYCNFSKNKFDNQLNIASSNWIHMNCTEIQALRDSRTQMLMYANMIDSLDLEDNMTAIDFWLFCLCTADYCYTKLIEKGWKPQQARVVLPLETYTEVVYTAFEDDWKTFFDLRLRGTTGAPHPDTKEVAQMVWNLFKNSYGVEL